MGVVKRAWLVSFAGVRFVCEDREDAAEVERAVVAGSGFEPGDCVEEVALVSAARPQVAVFGGDRDE